MSLTDRIIEDQEYHESLISALKYLDENNMLPEDQMRGISRKIIRKQRPDELNTESQRWEFKNYIEPYLEQIPCENESCKIAIGLRSLEKAFDLREVYGQLLCEDCLINKGREEYYASK